MEAERHKKEEAERRAKRKASKSGGRSDAQREKERKRKEHAQRILGRQNKGQSPGSSKRHKGSGGAKPPPPPPSGATPSHFQNLFTQRAQGFQIEFRFRNAPPRPPVGPCFVGHSLDGVLVERSRQYQASNAVEVNYKWKLHSEPDLGVPLAPSAMDVKSYIKPPVEGGDEKKVLHPDDEALLNWTGSLGDTAADNLKKRQDQLRAAARLALAEGKGRIPNVLLPANMDKLTAPAAAAAASVTSKKAFSRVLDETMQRWMKKTTYLSNNFSRKVHDFKSLATTKQQLKQDLEQKQEQMNLRRSAKAITNAFTVVSMPPVHPSKKHLKPKAIMPFLPNVEHWGHAYTHVVIDKAPNLDLDRSDLSKAFVANVEERKNRMVCQMWCPPAPKRDSDSEEDSEDERDKAKDEPGTIRYRPVQQFDLDVIPLKDEDEPHVNFCLWVDPDNKVSSYLPVSSRVMLSTGRPAKRRALRKVARQPRSAADLEEIKEQKAEVDIDTALELGSTAGTRRGSTNQSFMTSGAEKDDDDGDDDGLDDSDGMEDKPAAAAAKDSDSDDDSDGEATFGGMKTIVAES